MTDVKPSSELENFLEKYNIEDYSLIKHKANQDRYVIFNNEDNYYYKLSGPTSNAAENDLHYFLNHAHFPNHLVSSIIDTELNILIIKSSPAPGRLLRDILQAPKNTLDKNFIIKMMEWFKWQHTESRRLFPKMTDKYFTCLGICNGKLEACQMDLTVDNVIYDEETHRYTPIDFEKSRWCTEDTYILYAFNGINEVVSTIKDANSTNSNGWPSIREYTKLLDYCVEYIYKEIL
tara:strand:- start:659 stop:1360 length:702 start_codon:yes stop_codon:yes gene_type:complete